MVRDKGGYEATTDRYVDIRVDDHPAPIEELKRVFKIYDMTMLSREDPSSLLTIDREITTTLQKNLKRLGLYSGPVNGILDDPTRKGLRDFVNMNNFENRMREDGRIWRSILDYMEDLARKV